MEVRRMPEEPNLNAFIDWTMAGRRSAEIKINHRYGIVGGEKPIEVFIYDYDLCTGQSVTSVEQIDLEGKKLEREKAEYERLKTKFEPKLEAAS
jgi:hypothetical protein